MHDIWGLYVTAVVAGIMIPAVNHPVETFLLLTSLCGIVIWVEA